MLFTSINLWRIFIEFKKFKSFLITKIGMISKRYFLKNCSIVVQENNLIGNS